MRVAQQKFTRMQAQGAEKDAARLSAAAIFDTFKMVTQSRQAAEAMAQSAGQAVKRFYRNPRDLAAFIERHDTPVFLFKNNFIGQLFLCLCGFEPGFIPNVGNRRFTVLTRLLMSPVATLLGVGSLSPGLVRVPRGRFNTEHGLFVLTPNVFSVGFLSHQLHHWMSCRAGKNGYHERAQCLYRKFWNEQNGVLGAEVYDMSESDIIALRSAIHRDLEALEFLRKIADEILIPARQAKAFQSGSTTA